jgi:Protein of unknown function (DUF1698)
MSRQLRARAGHAVELSRRLAGGLALARRDKFVTSAPTPQNAVDAVPDRWASRFPPPHSEVAAGKVGLFADSRISWAFEQLGGIEDKTVLDLGPLEGAHSYMAQEAGASQIVGVEANRMAFLKCLVTKELLDLRRCSFLCGDLMQYLSTNSEQFDVCIASGILYHMVEPIRLIELISSSASSLIMWTHIYDDAALKHKDLAGRLSPGREVVYKGFRHHVYRHSYGLEARISGFSAGLSCIAIGYRERT